MHQLFLRLNPATIKIPVFITDEIWDLLLKFLRKNFSESNVCLIGDSNVLSIYQEDAERNLSRLANFGRIYSFPAGEKNKSRRQKAILEDQLLEDLAGRDSILLALGGGVTGDLVGFVAASLHRGIPLIHLPTSIIAQVDSSIGGKVGINHPRGKNLLGNFHQASAVFIHPQFLQTLPEIEFINGMAEVIKYAVTLDATLWDLLEAEHGQILDRKPDILEQIIRRSVELKIQVVEKDEKESEYRSLLNFGHTVGHAIEQLSQYQMKHGFAVAAGMLVAGVLSHQLMGYPASHLKRLRKTLNLFKLDDVKISKYALIDIWETIQTDKKARRKQPRFTLLDSNGQPLLFQAVSREALRNAVDVC